jgi:uncharacterized protein
MFINREKELASLEGFYTSKGAQFIIIYGKRRVGKTELIKQFIKGKPHVYLLADHRPDHEQISEITRTLGEHFHQEYLRLDNWVDLFKYLAEKAKDRFILVVDEFPHLVESNKAITSLFQKGWDEHLQQSRIFLILCGSSIGMMERETLAYRSPIYGRRTGQWLVTPMSPKNLCRFFPDLGPEQVVEFYSVLGGIPAYWPNFSSDRDVFDNIREAILTKGKVLYAEADFILHEELREPRNYFSVLRSLSFGNTRMNDIVNHTGLDKGLVSKYLSVLEDLHLITRKVPVTEKNEARSRNGIYLISDPFFKFWFRFIFPNKGLIEEGRSHEVIKEKIRPFFNDHVGPIFEDICREEILPLAYEKVLGFIPEKVGKWWHKEDEIDIVALNDDSKDILLGECKWRKEKTRRSDIDHLIAKTSLIDWNNAARKEHFIFFSKSGYTDDCKDYCTEQGILAIDLKGVRITGKSR